MDTSTQSLVGEFEELFKSTGLPTPPTEAPTTPPVTEPVVEVTVEEPTTAAKDAPVAPPVTADEPVVADTTADNDFSSYIEALGYTGENKTIESIDDIVRIAKETVEGYTAKLAVYERPEIKDVVEFISQGGRIDDYINGDHPTYDYKDVEFEADHITEAEEFVASELEGKVPQAAITATIKEYKETGKLIEQANALVAIKQKQEEDRNALIIAENARIVKETQDNQAAFVSNIVSTLSKSLNGVTAPKEVVELAKKYSVPDTTGNIEAIKIINSFTPELHAILNVAAICLKEGKPFSYTPTKATPQVTTPIANLFKKASGSETGQSEAKVLTVAELEAIAKGSK